MNFRASGRYPFRLFTLLLALFVASASCPSEGNSQQMVPVIRQVGPSASNVSVANTYLRIVNHDGCRYVLLEQAAAVFSGHLRWQRVARVVDLELRGHEVKFHFDSKRVDLDGRHQSLTNPTVKNDDGFWVPASFFATQRFFLLSQSRLDLAPPAPPAPVPVKIPEPLTKEADVSTESSVPALTQKQALASHIIRRIVIDPGHGGKDPGTVGAKGIEEKALNLQFAQELADRLREKDYQVLLTRTDDTFIPLAERARLANSHEADLFISIHCNASLSPNMHGLEVYFLSETASDPHADAVARAENASLALESKNPPNQTQVEALLRSLVKNANINESSTLGALVYREAGRNADGESFGVKQAGFYVLRGAEMPAVLIETGFLTNRADEKKLLDDRYRKRLVKGIVEAVERFDSRKRKTRGRS